MSNSPAVKSSKVDRVEKTLFARPAQSTPTLTKSSLDRRSRPSRAKAIGEGGVARLSVEEHPWYDSCMKKRISSPGHTRRATLTLGRERFAKISAVEGIELTPRMKQRAAEFDRRGLSAEERRRSIVRAYRKV